MIFVFTKCDLFKNGFKTFREKYISDCASFSQVLYLNDLDPLREYKKSQVKALVVDYEQADIDLLIGLVDIKNQRSHLPVILVTREARFDNTIENILINTVSDYTLDCTDPVRKLAFILRDLHGCTQHRITVKNSAWFEAEKATNLTRRESMILPYIVCGKNNKEISRYLNLSQKTISHYRRSIYDKFNVSNLTGLFNIISHIK